ncbi:MAG: MFS transporter, partial [Clostridia bacterium]
AQFTSGVLAPLILDRYRLQTIMQTSQASQTILLLTLTIITTLTSEHVPLYGLYGFILLIAFLDGWTVPARNAMIPRLVDHEQLLRANGLISTVDQSVQMIGWALGGILVAWLGANTILWLTVGMFLLSTVALFYIRLRPYHHEQNDHSIRIWDSLKEGWTCLWKVPQLRVLTMMDVLEGIAAAVWMAAILLVFVNEVLHKGEEWWGYINASYLIGTIVGGVTVLAAAKKLEQRLVLPIVGGMFLSGIFILLFVTIHIPVWSLFISALFGPIYQLQAIVKQTVYQRVVDSRLLPKVLSAQAAVAYVTFGLSAIGLSSISDQFGVQSTYYVSAGLTFIGTAIGFFNRKTLVVQNQENC